MKRLAIAIAATDMRVLPTTKPFFENAKDFPFDALQNTALKLNEPIKVLHVSRDRLWVFVETAGTNGWVQSRDVGYVDKKLTKKWMRKAQIVIVKDFTLIHDKSGFVAQKAKLGTICPTDGEVVDAYEISVAVNAGKHKVKVVKAKVPKESARRFPLGFNREFIAQVGNELINKPYGWGEMFQDRDCSSMIRDFYQPFGIWLPRGSLNQINSGRNISLAGLSGSEKERLIKEKGVPFLTLVYLKGHIMLYVGNMNGKALMFHDIWGVTVRNGKGGEFKQVIGKSIVSTLTPGSELDLAAGSLLERVSCILVLGDRCGNVRQ
jgi:SH3 domain (SH3b1 type)/NlpC/P60 family